MPTKRLRFPFEGFRTRIREPFRASTVMLVGELFVPRLAGGFCLAFAADSFTAKSSQFGTATEVSAHIGRSNACNAESR